MANFKAEFRTFKLISGEPNENEIEGDANALRALVPPGWQPILEAFLGDPDVTQMTVQSANLMQTFTFTRLVMGARAEPKVA